MMLKGVQRKLIMLQTRGSDLFETAYFVLKEDAQTRRPDRNEMLSEATRIVEENSLARRRGDGELRSTLITFVLGAFLGAFAVGAIWLSSLL